MVEIVDATVRVAWEGPAPEISATENVDVVAEVRWEGNAPEIVEESPF